MLPEVEVLLKSWQSKAMLDAILSPDWQYRYFSFNAHWGPGTQLGSLRNGSGDNLFAEFSSHGCWLKGFAHEFPLPGKTSRSSDAGPGVFDSLPAEFADCLREPAYNIDEVSFCLWRRYNDAQWQSIPANFQAGDLERCGSAFLLSTLTGQPETYHSWAEDYYETEVSLAAVEHIFQHHPLTPELVAELNVEVELSELAEDMAEIGYPGL